MFTLAIFCLTTHNLPWFMDLTFQVPMQYCSLQHWTLLSPPNTSTTEYRFCFGPAASFFLGLLVIALCSSPVAYWMLADPEGSPPVPFIFAFSQCPWQSPGKNTGVGCHFLLQWAVFCQNSSLWLVCLGWPCMASLIASLSYASPFITTRLWSMKGEERSQRQREALYSQKKTRPGADCDSDHQLLIYCKFQT